MVRYFHSGNNTIHRVEEYDRDSKKAKTYCGLTFELVDFVQDTSKDTVDRPDPAGRCGNCSWD